MSKSERQPYLTLQPSLCKSVNALDADTAWQKYRDQLAQLEAKTDRENDRQRMAWGAYQQLLAQNHALIRSMPALLLSKAGVGSRGGHQIGSTKSGKPIYESSHARYAAMHVHDKGDIGKDAGRVGGSFAHYSKSDHAEAASTHFKQAYKADHGRKSASPEGGRHLRAALAHNRLANKVNKSLRQLTLNKSTPVVRAEFTEGDMESENLEKSGAGSRGGKVIGTTKSGKPVYANRGAGSSKYARFSGQDHEDAQSIHQGAIKQLHQKMSKISAAGGENSESDKAQYSAHHNAIGGHNHQAVQKYHPMGFGFGESKTAKSNLTSADLYKSFLANGTFTSGNIENAETVDGLDGDMTGASSKGKSTSAPAGDDDRDEENKKVKKKVGKNDKNGGPGKSVESVVGVSESDAGKEDKLQDCGPYDFGGDVTDDIGVPPAGKLVDGYILRSEQLSEMMKGGEGSRGGKILGHTKSGKPVYEHTHHMYSGSGPMEKHTKGWSHQDHVDAKDLHDADSGAHRDNAAVASAEHEGLTGESGYRSGHHDRSDGADKAATMHRMWARKTNKSAHAGDMAKSSAYVGGDARTYQQRIEQRGFVQHATGGMDDYLAHISKSNGFYANGSDHHNPMDANHVAQTLCKSCDQTHSALYGVCPHCGPQQAFGKSYDPSQNHAGFGMMGREQGSTLVDMSAFSLED